MKTPMKNEGRIDLIHVSIKHHRGRYSWDSERSLDAQRSFLKWLNIFDPNAYDKVIEPLLLVKHKTIGKSCGGEPRLARNDGLKEKNMEEKHMPKISDHQEFLSGDMLKDEDLITLLNAGEFKDPSETGLTRTVFHINVELPDGRVKIWTCNKTSQKNIVKVFGDDTENWVDKRVMIRKVLQNVRGEMKDVLYGYPVEVDAATQIPLTSTIVDDSELGTPPTADKKVRIIRFIKAYAGYKVEDVATMPEKKADSLIELGFAVPIEST